MTVTHPSPTVQFDTLDSTLKTLFNGTAHELARDTKFVQRVSDLTGPIFARTLVFGWLANPDSSYTDLQQMMAMQGCHVSAQALEKRMTTFAADFLLALLYSVVVVCVSSEPVLTEILQRFEGVYTQDGSIISLPNELASLYKGCGGRTSESDRSALRIQVRFNLNTGQLQGPWIQPAVQSEREGPGSLQALPLPTNALYLTDSAFLTFKRIEEHALNQTWFLTHARADWIITDSSGIKSTVPQFLAHRHTQSVIDEWVTIGVQSNTRQRVRLVAMRVSPETAKRRQEQNNQQTKTRPKGCRRDVRVGKKHARPSNDGRHRSRVGKKRLELSEWTILVTNVPQERLAPHEARVLLRARWQIELLWRLWKERGQADIWRSEKSTRILCEIYAKLIGLVVQHWIILQGCWQQPHRSMVKASHVVQRFIPGYVLSFLGPITSQDVLQLMGEAMQRSRLNTRLKRLSTSQLLEDPTRLLA